MRIFATLVLALSTVNASGILFNQQPVAPFKSGDYTRCIDILQKVLDEAAELSKLVIVHDYDKVVPLALELARNMYEDIECFRDPQVSEVVKNFAFAFARNLMDPNECQMTHMKNAIAAFKIAVADIELHLYQEALAQLKIIIAEAQAAAECPQ